MYLTSQSDFKGALTYGGNRTYSSNSNVDRLSATFKLSDEAIDISYTPEQHGLGYPPNTSYFSGQKQ